MLASHSKVSDVGNATDLPVTSHTNLLHHHTPFAVPTGQKPDKSFALPTSLTPLTSPKVMLQVVLEGVTKTTFLSGQASIKSKICYRFVTVFVKPLVVLGDVWQIITPFLMVS